MNHCNYKQRCHWFEALVADKVATQFHGDKVLRN